LCYHSSMSEPPATGGVPIPIGLMRDIHAQPFPDLGRPPTPLEKHLFQLWAIHPTLKQNLGEIDWTTDESGKRVLLEKANAMLGIVPIDWRKT
jgi:hypothetical protein